MPQRHIRPATFLVVLPIDDTSQGDSGGIFIGASNPYSMVPLRALIVGYRI
jgi:hypothetical protein